MRGQRVHEMVRLPIFCAKHTVRCLWPEITRQAPSGGRREGFLRHGAFLGALLLVAVIAALAGGLLARHLLVAWRPLSVVLPTGHLAEAGGLLLRIESVSWEHSDPTAEPTHAVFVDGRPARYLQVRIALQNPTERSQAVAAQEFRLQARTGTTWASKAGSSPAIRLGPKEALSSILVFEVPATETAFLLVWSREGQELRIPLGINALEGKGG